MMGFKVSNNEIVNPENGTHVLTEGASALENFGGVAEGYFP